MRVFANDYEKERTNHRECQVVEQMHQPISESCVPRESYTIALIPLGQLCTTRSFDFAARFVPEIRIFL